MPTATTQQPPEVSASLEELQRYVAAVEAQRGFADESALQKCLLLGEEVGELFKAVRQHVGIGVDEHSTNRDVGDELADILNFVFAIANRFGVNLGQAFHDKEIRNASRVWVR